MAKRLKCLVQVPVCEVNGQAAYVQLRSQSQKETGQCVGVLSDITGGESMRHLLAAQSCMASPKILISAGSDDQAAITRKSIFRVNVCAEFPFKDAGPDAGSKDGDG